MASQNTDEGGRQVNKYNEGIKLFSLVFTRFMDQNEWSHPVMTKLAKCALNDVAWLHSSQISGLRHGKLTSPGPRTFVAIAALNKAMYEYSHNKKLIPGTAGSNDYRIAFCIEEDGVAPDVGWWVELFCGLRKPKDLSLVTQHISEDEAAILSSNWAKLIRKLAAKQDYDILEDLNQILATAYPARDVDRLARIKEVIFKETHWTPEELQMEMPAITAMTRKLGGPESEEELMDAIS